MVGQDEIFTRQDLVENIGGGGGSFLALSLRILTAIRHQHVNF
jgi:hypothetical protein